MALLVVSMLNLSRKKCLVLDRTNWKIGSTDVNILGAKAKWEGHLNGTSGTTSQPLRIAAKRLVDKQVLIVATNQPDAALTPNHYRRRWGIECLFGGAKPAASIWKMPASETRGSSNACLSSSPSP